MNGILINDSGDLAISGHHFSPIENNARYHPRSGYMILTTDPTHKNITVIANN